MDGSVDMKDFQYDLPADKIAGYPLTERDQAKLLVFKKGAITHARFDQLKKFLPDKSILLFNDTKVIPARLIFQKVTGAEIEIFLLNPVHPTALVQQAMRSTAKVQWRCSIGNLKRWTPGTVLKKNTDRITLNASLIHPLEGVIEFSWSPEHFSFAEVISDVGLTPLPPYIKRKAEAFDKNRYQTVYSHAAGAVAAPTAGLHFTEDLLERIRRAGMITDFLTLHVSSGTFLPVKVADAWHHEMHSEQIIISKQNIVNLLLPDKKVVAIGTTSLRTLESLYWFGAKLMTHPDAEFKISKFDPYGEHANQPTRQESFRAVAEMMESRKLEFLHGETSIYILPGYRFRVCDALITNFHQPGSTLLLLIAAFIGEDWKKVYSEALSNGYRFLSYGDSSLLIPNSRFQIPDSRSKDDNLESGT